MTVVKFFSGRGGITGFLASGHTGFASHGEDIVCSAISALTQTAVLGLKQVLGLDVELEIKEGYLRCELPPIDSQAVWDQSQLIFKVLYSGLQAIYEEYGSKYFCIKT